MNIIHIIIRLSQTINEVIFLLVVFLIKIVSFKIWCNSKMLLAPSLSFPEQLETGIADVVETIFGGILVRWTT